MSLHVPARPPEPAPEEAAGRGRSAAISAVAAALLSLPFLVYGVATLDSKARVELSCAPNGPCVLTRAGWLSRQEVGRFTLEELKGSRVERNRKSRTSEESIWRPVLVTTRGDFPLSYAWMSDERKAQHPATVVKRYLARPYAGGVTLWHDDRRGAARMGAAFISVGVLLLAGCGWLAFKARRLRRAERGGAQARSTG